MNRQEYEEAMRDERHRQSKRAILIVLGLAAFALLMVGLNILATMTAY
jgi:predicted nucleic acid-binding Zn ribbon protein